VCDGSAVIGVALHANVGAVFYGCAAVSVVCVCHVELRMETAARQAAGLLVGTRFMVEAAPERAGYV